MTTQDNILRDSIIIGVMRNHFFDQFFNPYKSNYILDNAPAGEQELAIYERLQNAASAQLAGSMPVMDDLGVTLVGNLKNDPDGLQKTAHLMKLMVDTLSKDMMHTSHEEALLMRGIEFALDPECVKRYVESKGDEYSLPLLRWQSDSLREDVWNAFYENDQDAIDRLGLVGADHFDGRVFSTHESFDDLVSEAQTLVKAFETAYFHPTMQARLKDSTEDLLSQSAKTLSKAQEAFL